MIGYLILKSINCYTSKSSNKCPEQQLLDLTPRYTNYGSKEEVCNEAFENVYDNNL